MVGSAPVRQGKKNGKVILICLALDSHSWLGQRGRFGCGRAAGEPLRAAPSAVGGPSALRGWHARNTLARLVAYGVAVLAPAVSLLVVRWSLIPVVGNRALYITFFPAVMIAAYLGGLWPGLLATLLSASAASFFLVEPRGSIHSAEDAIALIFFVLVGAFISGLCESLHRARRRIVANERQRAEETLRETEERFRQLAENIHEIFWIRDAREDRIIYVSPGFEEVWGRTPQASMSNRAPG